MALSLENKIVVITGATAGVGRATSIAFAAKKCKVILIARDEEGLDATRQDVLKAGGEAFVFPADVSDDRRLQQIAAEVEATIGPIDVWVNNAMCSVFAPIKEMDATDYKRVTEVTYLGQVYGTMSALKYMLPRNAGVIVLVGSALAYRGIPLQSAYCGAKHAIQGFFDSLRCELVHDKSNVHLTMVEMPALNTPQFNWVKSALPRKPKPMGKIFQPEVAARAIVYAATHKRREIYVGSPTFESIIGNKLAPWYLDSMLGRTGYKGQQTNEADDPGRDNNVWHPVSGYHTAHGRFDAQAHKHSLMLWVTTHRALLLTAVLLLAAIVVWYVY